MDLKAIFIDIDGTIVVNRKLVSSAHEVVHRLIDNGYHVALCTGRSTVHTRNVQSELQLENAVYFNGGLAINASDVTLSMPLSDATVKRIYEFTQRHQLSTIFHTQDETLSLADIPEEYQVILDDYQFPAIGRATVDDILSNATGKIYQANVFVTEDFDPLIRDVIPECLVYRWNSHAIDLQLLGCDKSIGARTLLAKWGIAPTQALHIGDGGNDIGMFQAMGMSVAMGNAEEGVKEHAKMITDRAENHGVLKAFENLNLI